MYLYVYAFCMYSFVFYMVRPVATDPLCKQLSNDVYKTTDDGLDDRNCSVVTFQQISITAHINNKES
jgi:hypothetical protein